MGEVDYTKAESLKLLLLILQENTNININDLNKSLTVKDTETIARVHFKNLAWTRLSIIAVVI